jgi:hypothetical protein
MEVVDKLFATVFNDLERYPTIYDVAKELGRTVDSVYSKASRMRRAFNRGDEGAIELISRIASISENTSKLKPEYTAEDCIQELLRIVREHPDQVISRNYFRVHSNISEATWTCHFGTFDEFKRQAGVTPTRQVRSLEKHIAKHVSVDHYRRLSDSRRGWGDRYERDSGKRFKTMLVASDLHDKEIDPFMLRVMLDTARRVQPDVISLVGDIFDLPEFGKYSVDPREWDVVGRIRFAHDHILGPLREAAPDAQFDFIEGNHECVTPDTEILCEDGWRRADQITSSDLVASYALTTERVSYEPPLAIKHIQDANLVSVTGDFGDELVSDTHRIDFNGKLTPVRDALGLKLPQYLFRYAVRSNHSRQNPISEDWVRLLTWVVMDATIVTRQIANRRIQFKLSKSRKIERLRGLLDRLDISYTVRPASMSDGNRLQPYYVCIYGDDARRIWDELGGIRQLPASWRSLDEHQVYAMLEEIAETDGGRHFAKISWRTTSLHDAETVQLACVLNGVPCVIREEEGRSGFAPTTCKTQYVVSIADQGLCDRRYVQITETGEHGPVVAIQTQNGTLITRRNGKVNFTGNCRLLRHLADASPAMRAVLSDLHGMTVPKLLGLDRFQINYIAKADLATFNKSDHSREIGNNYKVYWDQFLCHHFPHARQMGLPGVNGHHHRHEVWPMFNLNFGAYEWHQLGAGHKREASYCEGERWHNGFALVHLDTVSKSSVTEYIAVRDFAVVGGKFYYRDDAMQ